MEKYEDLNAAEGVLTFNVTDDVLERAAGLADGLAFTMNFCTYNYEQCGPIGDRA
jgi:hypothetical protein